MMHARDAVFPILGVVLVWFLLNFSPLEVKATQAIIAQSTGFDAPYTTYGSNIFINDPAFFVATGTVTSISFAPAISKLSIAGNETIQIKLYKSFSSTILDCQTPIKTVDEWGMSKIVKDPNAPVVNFGPFTGTQCEILRAETGDPNSVVTWLYRNGVFEGTNVKAMGSSLGANYTVYGQDIPDSDPCLVPGACASNVLFLPGIEGSRLYEGTGCGKSGEEKLWEPLADALIDILRGAGDAKMRDLFLNASGASACSDIYVKEGGVIDSVRGDNIYQTFIDEMNGLKTGGDINDWKAVAYDWRLSLDDLVNKGAARGGNVYYAEASSTPYIEQTLRALAGSSKTGKVSIVAHSNGGLVAKKLLGKLGNDVSKTLVDKLILVGSPQSGAPEALGAALVGHNAGIYKYGFPIVSNAVAREFAQNAPMVYHLFPSASYLASVSSDTEHHVAIFDGDGYAPESAAYGATIDSLAELDNFLLANESGRTDPAVNDLSTPEILSSSLIDYANTTHSEIDNWTPPSEIAVSQIAGWGADTISGIKFFTPPAGPERWYRPIFTEDGDGVVPVPSALMTASSTSVKRYWVDLHAYNYDTNSQKKHKDLFEIPSLETFIKNLIRNSTSTLPTYISTDQPAPTNKGWLSFLLHSSLTLELTDSSGHVTGIGADNVMKQNIPDSSYGEFGEVKYVTVPTGNYTLTMRGQGTGTFMLEMQEHSGNSLAAWTTFVRFPSTPQTLASLNISGGLNTASQLTIDKNGDGSQIITGTPILGQYVSYVEPEPDPPATNTYFSTTVSTVPTVPVVEEIIAPAPEVTTPQSAAVSSSVTTNEDVQNAIASSTAVSITIAEPAQVEEDPIVEPVIESPTIETEIEEIEEPVLSETPKRNVILPQTASVYDGSRDFQDVIIIIAYAIVIIICLLFLGKKLYQYLKNENEK